MNFPSSVALRLLVLVSVALFGCDEDGATGPGFSFDPTWEEVELPIEKGMLRAMASGGDRTLGVIVSLDGHSIIEQRDTDWSSTDLELEASAIPFDIALGSDGRGVLVGGVPPGAMRVWAERPTWTQVPVVGSGGLMSVTVDDAGVFYATGAGSPMAPYATGSIDGVWMAGTIPTPGDPQEKGIVAVTTAPSGRYACGWDDGGEGTAEQPYHLVLHDDGSGWEVMPTPCDGCSRREFRAIAANEGGAIFVGGAITDYSMGAEDESVAFLWLYSTSADEWIEIVLPDPGALDRVNDILVTSDGSVVLACGENDGAIVMLPVSGGPRIEWSDSSIELSSVAEDADGSLLAGGWTGPEGDPSPVLLKRLEGGRP